MQKVAKIIIDGQPFLTFRDTSVEGRMKEGGFGHLLRRLILTETNEKAVGCIVFYDELLSSYSWKTDEDTLYGSTETLELALANLLPHLPLGINHIKETFSHSSKCVIVEFGRNPDGFSEDKNTYHILLKDNFFKTAQRIVFKDGMSKRLVRREILQILLNAFEENPVTYVRTEDLQASIPVTTKELLFHLHLLKEEQSSHQRK